MAIVGAIKFVDRVVKCETLDKKIAFDAIRFQKIFIGDDWKGNLRWEETGRLMKSLGAELVYLPHTQGTSSTMLRNKLKDL